METSEILDDDHVHSWPGRDPICYPRDARIATVAALVAALSKYPFEPFVIEPLTPDCLAVYSFLRATEWLRLAQPRAGFDKFNEYHLKFIVEHYSPPDLSAQRPEGSIYISLNVARLAIIGGPWPWIVNKDGKSLGAAAVLKQGGI